MSQSVKISLKNEKNLCSSCNTELATSNENKSSKSEDNYCNSCSTDRKVSSKFNSTDASVDELFEVHFKVLKNLAEGKSFEEIEDELHFEFQVTDYLYRITTSGLLSFNDDNQLIGAYPISPFKTKYELEIEGIGKTYAMCAIDALGAAYTFNAKTTLRTKDVAAKKDIEITIDPVSDNQLDEDVVVTYTRQFKGSSAAVAQCPLINFYLTKDDVPKNLAVEILSFKQALSRGKEVFSPEGLKERISLGKNSPMNNCCNIKSN